MIVNIVTKLSENAYIYAIDLAMDSSRKNAQFIMFEIAGHIMTALKRMLQLSLQFSLLLLLLASICILNCDNFPAYLEILMNFIDKLCFVPFH